MIPLLSLLPRSDLIVSPRDNVISTMLVFVMRSSSLPSPLLPWSCSECTTHCCSSIDV